MELDYKLIGEQIKKYRKEKGLTQEQLAELTDYTANHISHVEVGSTKLSLPALVAFANALDVIPDRLLTDVIRKPDNILKAEFAEVVGDCTSEELHIIIRTAKTIKESMRNRKS